MARYTTFIVSLFSLFALTSAFIPTTLSSTPKSSLLTVYGEDRYTDDMSIVKVPELWSEETKKAKMAAYMEAHPGYWRGEFPPSSVMGPFLARAPSGLINGLSLVLMVAGVYSVHNSNVFFTLANDPSMHPQYMGPSAMLTFLSFFMHIAGWIQMKNGK
jgi:hypothetical protein